MILTAKQKYRLFLIVLLICFSGCTTYQKAASPHTAKKDEWFAKDKAQTYAIAKAGEADEDDASIIASRSQVRAVLLKKSMMRSNAMIGVIRT